MVELQDRLDAYQVKLYYVDKQQMVQIDDLQNLISQHNLALDLSSELIESKLNKKVKPQLNKSNLNSECPNQAVLLIDDKNKLSLLSDGLSVAPEWDKLQRRVVSAGRKSELILQAAKITANSYVIDATAGFGHDSLILASSGAKVTMLEQQPIMALLLLAEQQRMSLEKNWQKLMSRLHIINTDALSYFAHIRQQAADDMNVKSIDVIYLDPMFPADSYQNGKTGKGAKVGKQMQALHQLAKPPTLEQEQQLLQSAQALVAQNEMSQINVSETHATQTLVSKNNDKSGRVIVKRPQHAPFLANQIANESWHNDAVRFDGYFSQ